jgi:prevent-host-death family protein
MTNVSIRDLRNHGGDVIDRVARGEQVTITRGGRAVAQLRPVPSSGLSTEALLKRWSRLPAMDPDRLRRDVDTAIDSRL